MACGHIRPQPWAELPRALDELRPGHPRHGEVGDHQTDGAVGRQAAKTRKNEEISPAVTQT
jgi:hypothetical protein